MILIFETHPVQYRAPLYREVSKLMGAGNIKVIYGSDFSIRAYKDVQFGGDVDWGIDLLSGYDCVCLSNLNGGKLEGFWSLRGWGIGGIFEREDVSAIVLTSLSHAFDFRAYYEAKKRGIPVLIRTETQDIAFKRSYMKSCLRSLIYKLIYAGIRKGLPIGQLNAMHYRKHDLDCSQSCFVHYNVPNPYTGMIAADKITRRSAFRKRYGIPDDIWVVGFAGKLIDKKNPLLLLESLRYAVETYSLNVGVIIIGTGELSEALVAYVKQFDLPVWFTGFLDQNAIMDGYLAMDCLMLPSKQMGETWGLVVNEGLQAGCSIIVSEYVGSSYEFREWERVRVIASGDYRSGGEMIRELIEYPHDWSWCSDLMKPYTLTEVAKSFAECLENHQC